MYAFGAAPSCGGRSFPPYVFHFFYFDFIEKSHFVFLSIQLYIACHYNAAWWDVSCICLLLVQSSRFPRKRELAKSAQRSSEESDTSARPEA
jgi:hypothetical protein